LSQTQTYWQNQYEKNLMDMEIAVEGVQHSKEASEEEKTDDYKTI
jgi:hypothetical protein